MSDDLLSNLKASSKRWATQITQEANRNLGKYASLIKVSSKTVEEEGKLIIVSTGTSLDSEKPVARAYEYGSGIHSRSTKKSPHQESGKGYVKIVPKTGKALTFKWDTGLVVFPSSPPNKYLGKITKGKNAGKKMFLYVEHPGVEAANSGKGYMQPAITKVRAQIRKDIPVDIRKTVLGNFKKSFGVSKK